MDIDTIAIDALPGELRVAHLQDGRLQDLTVYRADAQSIVGNMYVGRVDKVHNGLQAAFIDIGLERAGFLALAEVRPPDADAENDTIGDYVREGDSVTVQVQRDPMETKGAKLTTELTVPGRFLVYTPCETGIRVSRRLAGGTTARKELVAQLESAIEEGEGLVVRTVAGEVDAGLVVSEVVALRDAWDAAEALEENAQPVTCIHNESDPLRNVLRNESGTSVRRIVVADGQTSRRLKALAETLAPDIAARIEPYDADGPLFENEGIEEQIEDALKAHVPLASGGSLIVQETAALVAIDVNTGGRSESGREETIARTNLEAVDEIVRQVVLRNLSGLILVDFVATRNRRHKNELLAAVRKAFEADRLPTHVLGYTPVGLLEMTRQRRQPPISQTLGASCGLCHGAGHVKAPLTVAYDALRAARAAARTAAGSSIALSVCDAVGDALDGAALDARRFVEETLGAPLIVERTPDMAPDGYGLHVRPLGGAS